MKGTLISSDFVTDKDNNLRLLEINTDTQIFNAYTSSLDLSDIHTAINDNSITEFHLVWKEKIHRELAPLISESISANCPGVTTYGETKVNKESIYPVIPSDASDKFILRLAYDENAILDSTYAKKNSELYHLYVSASEDNLVPEYYHSSSAHGVVDTLSSSLLENKLLPNIPDLILRNDTIQNTFSFIKSNQSDTTQEGFKTSVLGSISGSTALVQQFAINQAALDRGKVQSIREYGIIYDSDLKYTRIANGKVQSMFDIPSGSITASVSASSADDTSGFVFVEVPKKHFYEYTTKPFKRYISDGVLAEEELLLTGSNDPNDNWVPIGSASEGDVIDSFHFHGLPDSDDLEVIDDFFSEGVGIPTASYFSSASIEGKRSFFSPNNEGTRFRVSGSTDWTYIGGKARILIYNSASNHTEYIPVDDMVPNANIYLYDIAAFPENTASLFQVTEVEQLIFNDRQEMIELDVEPDDVFFIKSGDANTRVISQMVHNIFLQK